MCDTCTSREDSIFKYEKLNRFESINATENWSAAAIVLCKKEISKCQSVLWMKEVSENHTKSINNRQKFMKI